MARKRVREEKQSCPAVVDLFSGAGGISEGFKQAGFNVLGGSDIDPDAMATYALNFPEAVAVSGGIRDRKIREELIELAREADVLVGGPPCQAFSQVRNHSRLIDDPRNSLYREFVTVLRAALPPAFLVENVTGMDQMGVREQICEDLSLDGEYRVNPQVLDAADFGVPQTRKRLLFLGVRRSLAREAPVLSGTGATAAVSLERSAARSKVTYQVVIQPSVLNGHVAEELDDPWNARVVTVSDAISDLAGLPVGLREDEIPYEAILEPQSEYQRIMRRGAGPLIANVQVPRINEDTTLRLRGIPKGGNHRDLAESLKERYLSGQRWGQDNGSGRLSRRHFYAYRRLHPKIWAWTLNTKADSAYHYDVARALSVREFARLQSFPDNFIFTTDVRRGPIPGRIDGGAAHSKYRQAGNAVPPLLARAAARALLSLLRSPSLSARSA